MASIEWRSIPTVLYPQEILDKAFSRASKQANLVEDPDKYHRVRKQMNRMVQSAADIISTTLLDYVAKWPSLNSLSDFDQALVDAAVGNDDFRRNLGALQWASDKVIQIASDSQQKMLRLREIDGFTSKEDTHMADYPQSLIKSQNPYCGLVMQEIFLENYLPSIH